MQKKLLALAIAGALSAPLAAQAQNVQIYGLLQPSIDFVDNGDESGTQMEENNSRIGFRGTEDLGGGLKAVFQLESAVDLDDRGGAGWTRRDSWVGLAGSFGTVVVGQKFTAYKSSTDFVDPFGDTIGDYNNVFGVFESGSDGFNDRFTNGIFYTSPNFGGVTITASYGLNTNGGADFEDDGDDEGWSLAATYKAGDLTLVAAYEDQDDRIGDGTKAFKVAAGYKFGNTTVTGAYAIENFGDLGAGDDAKRDVLFAAVKHAIGNITLQASYTWADEFDDLDDSGVQAFALGAVYNFSKRTNIGAYYAQVKNDDNAFFGFDSGYDPAAPGEDMKGFSIRLRHSF